MDVAARVSSKGQVTVPKPVRLALGLQEGDSVVFRIDGNRATLARTADLLDLAGVVQVPADLQGLQWSQIRARARAARAGKRR